MSDVVSSAPLVSSSQEVINLTNAIRSCCDALTSLFQTTFEQVSNFASYVWSGVKKGDLFVDLIIRNLLLLEKHLSDLAKAIHFWTTSFLSSDLISFLYDIESDLIYRMQTNNFFYHTFWWIVKWVLSLVKYIRWVLPLEIEFYSFS